MRFTREQVVRLLDGAQASGRFHPAHRGYWDAEIRAGGPRAAAALVDLLNVVPAGPAVARRWADEARAGARGPVADPDETLYRHLYPVAAAGEPPSHEVVHPGGPAPTIPAQEVAADHPPTWTWHEHTHTDGKGGEHTHTHEHQGDARHTPGGLAAHPHDSGQMALPLDDPTAAGIKARAQANGVGTLTDDQIMRRLFGQ